MKYPGRRSMCISKGDVWFYFLLLINTGQLNTTH
jgi:hypothetical protein